MNIIGYRIRYYLGKLCAALGFCWRCLSALNFTRSGRGICPHCGHRY